MTAVIKLSKYSLLKMALHCDQCWYSPWAKLAVFSIKPEKYPFPWALLGWGCSWNCHPHTKAKGLGFTNAKPNWEIFMAVPLTFIKASSTKQEITVLISRPVYKPLFVGVKADSLPIVKETSSQTPKFCYVPIFKMIFLGKANFHILCITFRSRCFTASQVTLSI